MSQSTFDHETAMAEISAYLTEHHTRAPIWHFAGGQWVEYHSVPAGIIENLTYVLTLVERDAAEPYPETSQLRHEVAGTVRNAFKAGYEAGQRGELSLLRAVLDGQLDEEYGGLEADELIWLRHSELGGWPDEEVGGEELDL